MIGDTEYYVKGIAQRKSELSSSSWLPAFWALLDPVVPKDVSEIRCLALGLVCDHLNPRFQLALLLLMAEHFKITSITAWDPIFTDQDRKVLEHFNIEVKEADPVPSCRILWYIPHGPLKLIASLVDKLASSPYIGNDLTQFDLDGEDGMAALATYRSQVHIRPVPVGKHDRWSMAFSSMAIHSTAQA